VAAWAADQNDTPEARTAESRDASCHALQVRTSSFDAAKYLRAAIYARLVDLDSPSLVGREKALPTVSIRSCGLGPCRVDVVHPRRRTEGQRLQTNATLAAFEEADLFAKVSGYLSDVRVDIGDHVKAGQVLAVIDIPEMEQELAEDKA
jgi:acetyl/propionyl-CoA carboxylase alpha subunit